MDNLVPYTASQAREDFYTLVKRAAKGIGSFEINLRGQKPVVLISKEELDGWLETLDIMSNPKEVEALRKAKKEKATVSFKKVLDNLGFNEKDFIQKESRKRA